MWKSSVVLGNQYAVRAAEDEALASRCARRRRCCIACAQYAANDGHERQSTLLRGLAQLAAPR